MIINENRTFHAFQIIPISEGVICIHKGFVYYFGPELQKFTVEGATGDLNLRPSDVMNVTSGDLIKVQINHTPKDEEREFVEVETCLIVVGATPNPDRAAVVDVGSVTWSDGVATVDQKLKGDIYCSIPGTQDAV